jgi:hypothetical protein
MRCRSFLLIPGLLVLLGVTAAAHAESPAQAITRWGLVGHWRWDCSVAPTEESPAIIWSVQNGAAFFTRDYGAHQDTNPVESAVIRPDGMIDTIISFGNRRRINENRKSPDGSMYQNVFNKDPDSGVVVVKDGVILSSGGPMAWMRRCR